MVVESVKKSPKKHIQTNQIGNSQDDEARWCQFNHLQWLPVYSAWRCHCQFYNGQDLGPLLKVEFFLCFFVTKQQVILHWLTRQVRLSTRIGFVTRHDANGNSSKRILSQMAASDGDESHAIKANISQKTNPNHWTSLKLTLSLLKMDTWKTSCSLLAPGATWQVLLLTAVSFEGVTKNLLNIFQKKKQMFPSNWQYIPLIYHLYILPSGGTYMLPIPPWNRGSQETTNRPDNISERLWTAKWFGKSI